MSNSENMACTPCRVSITFQPKVVDNLCRVEGQRQPAIANYNLLERIGKTRLDVTSGSEARSTVAGSMGTKSKVALVGR